MLAVPCYIAAGEPISKEKKKKKKNMICALLLMSVYLNVDLYAPTYSMHTHKPSYTNADTHKHIVKSYRYIYTYISMYIYTKIHRHAHPLRKPTYTYIYANKQIQAHTLSYTHLFPTKHILHRLPHI